MKDKKIKNKKSKKIEGIIFVTKKGTGYVKHVDFDEDIEISNQYLNTALNGDEVEIHILPRYQKQKGGKNRVSGAVHKVKKRAKLRFVGTIEHKNNRVFLVPDDANFYTDIQLSNENIKNIKEGKKAYVKMLSWSNSRRNPEGELIKILGNKGENETEMQSIILEHGFDSSFKPEIEKEAKKISQMKIITDADEKVRKDFRGILTFTIDPDDAKDFDDAISIQYLENGDVEIGIHIADVSHYVRPLSIIDKEAQNRATSIYLVDRTIPMLPEILSNDVCSLKPNEDKKTFSAVFVLSKNAVVKKRWFGETIIHSNKRFTYEEAQDILNKKEGVLYKELNTLNLLAKKIRNERKKIGAIEFDQDEVYFKLDKSGKPIEILKKKRQDTNLLIEDFMLLANQEVAEYVFNLCKKMGVKSNVFIYRIHDVPDIDKIEELGIFLRAIGHDFDTKNGNISARDINKLFKQIEGTPEENLIKTATIRSMAKAIYSTKNIGHFGLAFKYYTHFTSPIRRYPDILVHRILKNHLNKDGVTKKSFVNYEQLAIKSSQREIEAVKAERDSIKYKQVEYMSERIGEEFDGIINGVTEWGIYVEEVNTKAEGLVRIGSIGGDFFILDKKKYQIIGKKTKKKFALGDIVRIKLVGTNLEKRTIDFKFV